MKRERLSEDEHSEDEAQQPPAKKFSSSIKTNKMLEDFHELFKKERKLKTKKVFELIEENKRLYADLLEMHKLIRAYKGIATAALEDLMAIQGEFSGAGC